MKSNKAIGFNLFNLIKTFKFQLINDLLDFFNNGPNWVVFILIRLNRFFLIILKLN